MGSKAKNMNQNHPFKKTNFFTLVGHQTRLSSHLNQTRTPGLRAKKPVEQWVNGILEGYK